MAEQEPKSLVVKSSDSLPTSFPPQKVPITDGEIRNILLSFHGLIKSRLGDLQPATGGSMALPRRPMTDEELLLWNAVLGVENRVKEKAAAGKLFVVSESGEPNPIVRNYRPQQADKYTPTFLTPLDLVAGVQFFSSSGITFERAKAGEEGGLAQLFTNVHVQDSLGRWVIGRVPGMRVDGKEWPSDEEEDHYDYKPASGMVNFNTIIDPTDKTIEDGIFNNRSKDGYYSEHVRIQCAIHRPNNIGSLFIPEDPQLRLIFWQIKRDIGQNLPKPESTLQRLREFNPLKFLS